MLNKRLIAPILLSALLLASCSSKKLSTSGTLRPSDSATTKTQAIIESTKKPDSVYPTEEETEKKTEKNTEKNTEKETEKTTQKTEVASTSPSIEPTTQDTDIYAYDTSLDKTKPLLVNYNKDIYLEKGKSFIPDNYISYIDDYDRAPELTYTGSVNIHQNGNYPITVTVKDRAGNSSSVDLTVHIYEKSTEVATGSTTPPETKKTLFADAKNRYKTDSTSIGIDVSRWQGDIDFQAVKDAGCEFVIMRIGTFVDDEIGKDIRFDEYYKAAKAAGLKIGVYLYSEANTVDEARANANWICDVLGDDKLDFPIAFDWEDWTNIQDYHVNLKDINAIFDEFANTIEKRGRTSMLYSSRYYLQIIWSNQEKRPVWLAVYSSNANYSGDYMLWQFCCDGKISGINADVDINVWYH